MRIHKTSIVHKNTEIAENVEIGAFCVIDEYVKIGSGSIIRPYVHICSYTEIGKNNIVHQKSYYIPVKKFFLIYF